MKRRTVLLIVLMALVVLATAGLVDAASSSTVQLRANLKAAPKQQVSVPNASARFSSTLVVRKKTKSTLGWRLTYSGLSGAPTLAYIALPKSAKQGEVTVQLCKGRRCKTGVAHSSRLPAIVAKALATRKGYVWVRTKKNPKGEIRGRIVRSG